MDMRRSEAEFKDLFTKMWQAGAERNASNINQSTDAMRLEQP